MEYQPGDVVNGYVLGTDNQWHPVQSGWAAPGQAPADPRVQGWGQQPGQPGPAQWGQAQGQQQGHPGWQQWGQPAQPGAHPWGGQPGPGGPAPGAGQWNPQALPAGQPPGPPKPSGPIYKRWWFWVAAGLLVVVVGVVAVAAVAIRSVVDSVATTTTRTMSSRTIPTTPRTTAPRSTATSTATSRVASVAPIGQVVKDGATEFTVISVECGATDVDDRLVRATATGTFWLVQPAGGISCDPGRGLGAVRRVP